MTEKCANPSCGKLLRFWKAGRIEGTRYGARFCSTKCRVAGWRAAAKRNKAPVTAPLEQNRNAVRVTHRRQNVTGSVTVVGELAERVEVLLDVLASSEDGACAWCHGEPDAHADDCELVALLDAVRSGP